MARGDPSDSLSAEVARRILLIARTRTDDERHLDVLGVDRTVTVDGAKAAYKRLAKLIHPDKCGGDQTCEAAFRIAKEARDALGSAECIAKIVSARQRHELSIAAAESAAAFFGGRPPRSSSLYRDAEVTREMMNRSFVPVHQAAAFRAGLEASIGAFMQSSARNVHFSKPRDERPVPIRRKRPSTTNVAKRPTKRRATTRPRPTTSSPWGSAASGARGKVSVSI